MKIVLQGNQRKISEYLASFMNTIHLFNKYLWSVSYVPGTVLDIRDRAVIKMNYLPWLVWLSGLSVGCEPKGHQFDS